MIQMRHIACNVEDRKSLLLRGGQGTIKREEERVIIWTITQMYIVVRCHIISELSGANSFPEVGFLVR